MSLLLVSLFVGGTLLVYTLGRLMFPNTDVSGLLKGICLVSALGGALVGALGGFVATRGEVLKRLLPAGAPLFAFGALLLPKLFGGHWVGVALWWAGGCAVVLAGFLTFSVVATARNRLRTKI